MFLFAIIFSIIIKNPGGDDEEDDDEEECKIAPKEDEMLHQQDEGRLAKTVRFPTASFGGPV